MQGTTPSPHSVTVARYGALIRVKTPTNCDEHFAEALFKQALRFIYVNEYAENGGYSYFKNNVRESA